MFDLEGDILVKAGIVFLLASIGLFIAIQPGIASDKPIQIAVSIPPQAWLVQQIAGDLVEVSCMIPTGRSPATYEPSPRELVALHHAQIYVKVGHPNFIFERKHIDPLLAERPDLRIINMSDSTTYLKANSNHYDFADIVKSDPHVWVAPATVRRAAVNIERELAALYPKHAGYFRKNTEKLLNEIDALDQRILNRLSGLKNRKFMVYHPSWEYFARQYNLVQVAIEEGGKEPGSSGLVKLIEQARRERIHVIFVQKGFNTSNAKIIAREIHGQVVEIDPLAFDWLANMEQVSIQFQNALREP